MTSFVGRARPALKETSLVHSSVDDLMRAASAITKGWGFRVLEMSQGTQPALPCDHRKAFKMLLAKTDKDFDPYVTMVIEK
eukprot:1682551-Amphidinium_carterae.1